MLRVQKKKSMLSRKLDKGMMLGLTRTAIRKKGAVGYGKKIGMGHGKIGLIKM